MITARPADIKVGNFVILKYENEGPGTEAAPGDGWLQLLLRDEDTGHRVYSLIEIKDVKDGKINELGYQDTAAKHFIFVDKHCDRRIIEDYEKYMELLGDAEGEVSPPREEMSSETVYGPCTFVSADEEVAHSYRMGAWAKKRFLEWKAEEEKKVAVEYDRDKLVFTMDMLDPATVDDIDIGAEAYVIVRDGKFEIELDNEHVLMPKVIWLSKKDEAIQASGDRWGEKKDIPRDELEGMHSVRGDLEWDMVLDTYYSGDEDPLKVLTKMLTHPNIELECDKILELIRVDQDFLVKPENMPFLAYLMLRWQNLYYAGRICYGYSECLQIESMMQCTNNPKYEFEGMENSESNENVIYDAWAIGIRMESILPHEWLDKFKKFRDRVPQFNEQDFDDLAEYYTADGGDEFEKLQHKKNKTMDEWYALLGNPKYRYHSLYGSEHAIDDHMLCVIGNGYGWNEQGFLTNDGPSGGDDDDYGKFPMLKGHSTGRLAEIESALDAILLQPHVQRVLDLSREWWMREAIKTVRNEICGGSITSAVFDLIDEVEGREKPKPIATRVLETEANARGFNRRDHLPVFDRYEYIEDLDILKRIDTEGHWLEIYEKGKWTDIKNEDGEVVPIVPEEMEAAKEFIDLLNRVFKRGGHREHPLILEKVGEAFEEYIKKDEIAAALRTRSEYYKREKEEEEEQRIKDGRKPRKEMSLLELQFERAKIIKDLGKDLGKEENQTKGETEADGVISNADGVISNAVDAIKKLVRKKMDTLTDEEIFEIGEFEERMMDLVWKDMPRQKGRYYQLSRSSRIMKIPENAHPSFFKAGIKIMEEIIECYDEVLENAKQDHDESTVKSNLKKARIWLSKHGPEKYRKYKPRVVDTEKIFQELKALLAGTETEFPREDETHRLNVNGAPPAGRSMFYRVDRSESDYSYDTIVGYFNLEGVDGYPETMSNDIDVLEGTALHGPIKVMLAAAGQNNNVKNIDFFYNNILDSRSINIKINLEGDKRSYNFSRKIDAEFVKQGFLLGNNTMALKLDDVILVTSRAKTLGLKHPDNKSKREFLSNAQYFDVYDPNWKKLGSFDIDERGFNTFSGTSKDKELTEWLTTQHGALKSSDTAYGSYNSKDRDNSKEGRRSLYAHDFMLWLREHQLQTA